MNNDILFTHPTLGNITFNDLITDLEIMLTDTSFFEDIVFHLLKQTQLDDEDISSIYNYSIINRLEWIIYVLKKIK